MMTLFTIYFILSLDRSIDRRISFVYLTTVLCLFIGARPCVRSLRECGGRRRRGKVTSEVKHEGRSAPNARGTAGGRPRSKVSLPLAKSSLDLFLRARKNNLNDRSRNVHYRLVEENGNPATENQVGNGILSSKGSCQCDTHYKGKL